jgi:signal transduction histidine kinase
MTKATSAGAGSRVSEAAFLLLAAALVGFTILVVAVPQVAPALVSERLDLAIGSAAVLASGAVAALQWARGRVQADAAAMLRGSAFAVLTVLNGMVLAVLLAGAEDTFGASLADPGQVPLVVTMIGRAVAATLLVLAGLAMLRRAVRVAPGLVLLGPSLVVVALAAGAAAIGDRLPEIAGAAALDGLTRNPTEILAPGGAPLLVIGQATIGVAFLAASALAYRSYLASGRLGEGIMAAGLVVAAFSQVHSAVHPGSYAGLVTTADLLRLAFSGVLLVGIVVDHRDDLRALRQANVDLRRLADAELATAALEERARLAREIHDGLAQDLWFAKLKQSRLAQQSSFSGESLALSREVEGAIDAALAEARHAVAAMRQGADAGSLADALGRHVDDFSDRFALRAELAIEGPAPSVAPRAQAEILRIVQEALTNARRHADATVVRVAVRSGDELLVTITDNGRGFRPEAVTPGFGLESMRQRAALIGATVRVASAPQSGTTVTLAVPSDAATRGEDRDDR